MARVLSVLAVQNVSMYRTVDRSVASPPPVHRISVFANKLAVTRVSHWSHTRVTPESHRVTLESHQSHTRVTRDQMCVYSIIMNVIAQKKHAQRSETLSHIIRVSKSTPHNKFRFVSICLCVPKSSAFSVWCQRTRFYYVPITSPNQAK